MKHATGKFSTVTLAVRAKAGQAFKCHLACHNILYFVLVNPATTNQGAGGNKVARVPIQFALV
jgi:hypothetical protein